MEFFLVSALETVSLPNALAAKSENCCAMNPTSTGPMKFEKGGLDAFTSSKELCDETVDLSYSLDVLEHIEDDRQAIRGTYRVLKPRSLLVVYVPAMPCHYSSMDEKVQHFRRYMRKELSNKLI